MTWLIDNFHIVLIVSGLLTATMLQFAITPVRSLKLTYGETLEGPLVDLVVRGWGFLIALVGAMLLWAAFHPETRTLAVGVAIASKLFYIAALLAHRERFLKGFAAVTAGVDVIMVGLMAAWLAGTFGRV
jgi:hypothetical protein